MHQHQGDHRHHQLQSTQRRRQQQHWRAGSRGSPPPLVGEGAEKKLACVERQVRHARAVQHAKDVLGAKDARARDARERGLLFVERLKDVSVEALVAVKELLFRDNHK